MANSPLAIAILHWHLISSRLWRASRAVDGSECGTTAFKQSGVGGWDSGDNENTGGAANHVMADVFVSVLFLGACRVIDPIRGRSSDVTLLITV